jgi:hypothetical protein
MKLIRLILVVVLAANANADEELPGPIQGLLLVDAYRALTKNGERPSQNDVDSAIREASTLLHFNPGALKEFEALMEQESGGSGPISAVTLQEVINDYELLVGGRAVPTLISSYIARSKVETLSQRQRVLCYVMIKSAMRHIRATQEKK